MLGFTLGIVFRSDAAAQDSDSSHEAELLVRKIQQVQSEYKEFLEKRARIQKNFQAVEQTLTQTEAEFTRIGNEEIRQQMSAMQSMVQSEAVSMSLSTIVSRNQSLSYNRLLADRMMLDLNTTLRSQEIQQLDAAARAVLQRRFRAFQEASMLQENWAEWTLIWPQFMDRYWPFSDPERHFSEDEVSAAIEQLQASEPEDHAAKIALALLMERAGRINEGVELTEQILAAHTSLQPIAWATNAILLHSVDKDKEAQNALQLALKANRSQPYVRWIHARIAADQQRWAVAEKEVKQLISVKPLELGARRFQSLILAAHAEKLDIEGKKAVKEAQLALDLLPQPTWYSYLVLAIAQYSAKIPTEALKSLERAERTASPSQLDMCQRIRLLMEEGKEIEWDFLERTSSAVQP